MRIGSLFSGIGGLELGMEWAGVGHTVFQVEKEEFCRAILERHWPSAQRFTDIRLLRGRELPECDVLCGGFPCQDISFAGKGAGLAGERSGLWREWARVLGEMSAPPRYIVIENVSALRARGLGEVVLDLASLGYVSWWDCIPAAAVGAPHRRDRLFLLAYRDRERRREEKSLQAGRNFSSSSAHMAYPDVQRGDWRGTSSAGRQELAHGSVGRVCATRTIEPSVDRAVDGLPGRLDRWPARPGEPQYEWEFSRCTARGETKGRTKRLKALGNAVVPQVGYVVGRALLMLDDMLKNI